MDQTITAFCANDQADTTQSLKIDVNGEILLTCMFNRGTDDAPDICGRTLKFPRGTDSSALSELLSKHKEGNEGQLTVEAMEAEQQELIDGLDQGADQ